MRQHVSGEPVALRGLMLDARARRADDGELGRDEQPVGEEQEHDDAERQSELDHASSFALD